MKKNLEIKYKPVNSREIIYITGLLKNYSHTKEKQTDIYYETVRDRLKLRIINDSDGSLILYSRAEKKNKRISNYTISKTKDYRELDYILRKQFKVLVTVIKMREIFIYKNLRVHIDKVKNLGRFLEIEIIYDDLVKAKKQMKELIELLSLDERKFI